MFCPIPTDSKASISALISLINDILTALERELIIGKGVIKRWETSSPNADNLQKSADYFHVSVDYLLAREERQAELNKRDKKDIAKNLEEIMNQLESEDGVLSYRGEVTESHKELYRVAIPGALEMLKLKNK